MHRRVLLGSITVGVAAVSGCLDDDTGEAGTGSSETADDETTEAAASEYEECHAPFVDYDELPDEIAAEVDAAFDDGEYVTNDDILYEQAVGDGTPLWTDETPYEHRVETDGETRRLSFEEQSAYSSPRDLEIWNDTAEPRSVVATVTDEDGELVVDAALTVEANDRKRVEAASRFGTYDVVIELDDGRTETWTWDLFAPRVEVVDALTVTITDDELWIEPLISSYDFESCAMQWGMEP